MWDKIVKEVHLGRVAGPFEEVPYFNYMQSPIGLFPKAGGKTRLIFHLSYQFPSGLGSLNGNMCKESCSVKYQDLDKAVKACLELFETVPETHQNLYFGRSDLVSALRILPCCVNEFRWLIMMASDPLTKIKYYFLDKSIPFGRSVSCSHFQAVSDGLTHITNY